MLIRPASPDDATAIVSLRSVVYPFLVRSSAAFRQYMANATEREQRRDWVAELNGQVAGYAGAGLNIATTEPGAAWLNLCVHPDRHGRGIGSALLSHATEHLQSIEAGRIRAWALPDSRGFAQRHGYEPSREVRYSGVQLEQLPEPPALPTGTTLVPLTVLSPRQVFDADKVASLDEPGDIAIDDFNFTDWERDIWRNGDLDREASVAAIVDNRIAALTLVERSDDRAWSGFTGTIPEYRGRGLAKLVKSEALRRAAASGATSAFTANDETNGPMLAVNDWLGYHPVGAQWSCLRELN